jgi:hypothetical protein
MANRLKAVNFYRPRLDLGNTVQTNELTRFMADRSNLNQSLVDLIVGQLHDAIVFFNAQGRGVKVEGLGSYLPGIELDGTLTVEHRLDPDLKKKLNLPDLFTGTIINRDNIGMTVEKLIALWNMSHPDDPVV